MQLSSKGQKDPFLNKSARLHSYTISELTSNIRNQISGEGKCAEMLPAVRSLTGFSIQVTGFDVAVCHNLLCLAQPCATLRALPRSCACHESTEQPCSWAGWKPDFCPLAVTIFLTTAVFGWWVILAAKGVRSTHRKIRNRHYTAELPKTSVSLCDFSETRITSIIFNAWSGINFEFLLSQSLEHVTY